MEIKAQGIAAGIVVARGCTVEPSRNDLRDAIYEAIEAATAAKDSPESAARKTAARTMLRFGSYRPTGRGKPASEYLLNCAAENNFPFINNLVDINNLVSLKCLFPISMIDLGRTGAHAFHIRRGREGEEYVFNPSGQVLDLKDLLLAAALPDDVPCGTPVKDSQATKTSDETKDVLAVIYAPSAFETEAVKAASEMAALLERHCGAQASALCAVA
jgi:DNA/RNA-binding domain of Phe-tRNA-synthetase-like protein